MPRAFLMLTVLFGLSALTGQAGASELVTVTLNKAQTLRLDRPAAIIILADPKIADVVLENPRFMFMLGKQAGETSLTILDANKNTILEATLAVVPEDERHISILRHCRGGQGGGSCVPEETLNCVNGRCSTVPSPGSTGNATGGGGTGAP